MSTIFARGVVLGVSRLVSYGVMFASPVILVRILDVVSYGQYREFLLYSMFVITTVSFVIKGNLIYFIPRNPELEAKYVFNTLLLLFLSSLTAIALVILFKPLIVPLISFDFVVLLCVYVFVYVNPDIVETYWLSKKRSGHVLKYTSTIVTARLLVVVLVALWSGDVVSIVYGMIAFESIKAIALVVWLLRDRIIHVKISVSILKEQFVYILPLWVSAIIFYANNEVGKLFTSINLGVAALAVYTIGSYPIPLMGALRASVSDVILPDTVERANAGGENVLGLWKKSNILFCLVTFPTFVVLFYYTDFIIEALFTSEYSDADVIFRIYLISMVIHCFEMGVPLKAIGANRYFVSGNLIALFVNMALLSYFTNTYGLAGPALSLIAAEIAMYLYVGRQIALRYQVSVFHLFTWRSVSQIALVSAIGFMVFGVVDTFVADSFYSFVLGVSIFSLFYLGIVNKLRIEEANWLFSKLRKMLSRS